MDKMQLYFLDMYIEENYGWFAAYNCNGVFRINFITGDVDCMGIFPVESKSTQAMYNGVVCHGDQIIFIPDMFGNIGIYDKKSGKVVCKEIPQEITDKKSFCFSVLYKNNLMLFQSSSSLILKYDIEKQLFSKVEINGLEKTGFCFVSRFVVQYGEEKVFTLVKDKNAILEINLSTGCYRFHRIGNEGDIFFSMCRQDENIWLAEAHSGKLVKYEIEKETYREFIMLPEGYRCIEGQKLIISYLFFIKNWIYIVSSTANMMLRFNITTELYEIMDMYDDWKRMDFPFYIDMNHWVLSCQYADKKIYSLWAGDLQLSVYDTEDRCKKKKLKLVTDKKRYMQQYYQFFPHKVMLSEDIDSWELKEYLMFVRDSQKY